MIPSEDPPDQDAEIERWRARHRELDAGAPLTRDELRAMTRSSDLGMAPARSAARRLLEGDKLERVEAERDEARAMVRECLAEHRVQAELLGIQVEIAGRAPIPRLPRRPVFVTVSGQVEGPLLVFSLAEAEPLVDEQELDALRWGFIRAAYLRGVWLIPHPEATR